MITADHMARLMLGVLNRPADPEQTDEEQEWELPDFSDLDFTDDWELPDWSEFDLEDF